MKNPYLLFALAGFIAVPLHAESNLSATQSQVMNKLLVRYAAKAKVEAKQRKAKEAGADKPFTAEAGREFYLIRRTWQLSDFTCSGCHGDDPRKEGTHIETRKPIKPLAPSANPQRFTNVRKVETNFTAHCMDLHERDCHAYEKGNFIAYLMSVK